MFRQRAHSVTLLGQSQVGVVLPQQETILGPGGEHAIRFFGTLGDQVIDQHADISLVAADDEFRRPLYLQRRVDPSDDSLGRRLLIARRAVDLTRKEQIGPVLQCQGMAELQGQNVVVFHRVARPDDFHPLQTGNRAQISELARFGQARGKPVGIDFLRVQSGRLQKDLVPLLVGKLDDFILDGGAIPGPNTLDRAAIHGRKMEIVPDHLMGSGVGVGDKARDLRQLDAAIPKAELADRLVPFLLLQSLPIDGVLPQPGGRAGFQPAHFHGQPTQGFGQRLGRRFADSSRLVPLVSPVDQAVEEGAGGDDDGTAQKNIPIGATHTGHPGSFGQQLFHRSLANREALLPLHPLPHASAIAEHVRLATAPLDGGTLGTIEHAELDAGRVGHQTHGPAEGVDLLDQIALGQSTDGRIARHVSHRLHGHRHHEGLAAHPCRRQSRLTPRMAAPHHDHVI